ncbi:50S ribosomal protein L19 [bacterium]|jgi:large subunit ribosomal protein L19|nr:50S ribosomal protein L19 [bacterium]NBX78257.1 50S ribosomal protein L19 [bacterium]
MKAKGLTKETIQSLGMYDRNFPKFTVGDLVAVSQWVKEGDNKRVQVFEGNVIAMKNRAASSTFTVRKMGANSVAVERIYPLYSPLIESIKLVAKAKVRRAKLFYLRDRVGKAAQIKEDLSAKGKARAKAAVAHLQK